MGKKHKLWEALSHLALFIKILQDKGIQPLKMKKVAKQENLKPYYDLYKG